MSSARPLEGRAAVGGSMCRCSSTVHAQRLHEHQCDEARCPYWVEGAQDGRKVPETRRDPCAKGEFPAHLDDLAEVTVIYETFPGWEDDLSKIRTFAELPQQAQTYLLRLQELLEVPLSYIGVGPDRNDMFLV